MAEDNGEEASVGRALTGSLPLRIQSTARMASEVSTRSVGRESSKKKSSSRKSVAVNSNFIKAKTKGLDAGDGIGLLGKIKLVSAKVLQSRYFVNAMAVVVMIDAYCTCRDIDSRAAKITTAAVAQTLSDICLALYTLELAMAILVSGWSLLKDWSAMIDVAVVLCGFVEIILNAFQLVDGMFESVGVLRVLRIMRIVRLSRLLRKTRALRELQKLVRMMATCLKALLWSFVFCFMVMTVWAMLIVEWIHPWVEFMYENTDQFRDCDDYCLQATSSVMDANLLLFKTVIAGDSWGLIAVPVIRQYPPTAIIFMGSLLTLVFGVLNLIVAVVVDNFAEARQRDVLNLAEEMEDNLDKDTRILEAIFQRIDKDGSGQLTFKELVEGARKDKEFQSRLRVMDIDEADLQQLFEMIDTTGEGYIEVSQFIAPMTRWVHDSKTAARFNKYNMLRTLHQQEEFFNMSQDYLEALSCRVDRIAEKLGLDIFPEEEFTRSFRVGSSSGVGSPGDRKWSPTRQVAANPFVHGRQHNPMSAAGSPQRFAYQAGPSNPGGEPRLPSKEEASKEGQKDQHLDTFGDNMESEGVEQPHSSTKMSIGKADGEPEALEPKVPEQDTSLRVAMQKWSLSWLMPHVQPSRLLWVLWKRPCRKEHRNVMDTHLITQIYFGCLSACAHLRSLLQWGICIGEGQMKPSTAEDCAEEATKISVSELALRSSQEEDSTGTAHKCQAACLITCRTICEERRQGARRTPIQELPQGLHSPTGHILEVSVLLPPALRWLGASRNNRMDYSDHISLCPHPVAFPFDQRLGSCDSMVYGMPSIRICSSHNQTTNQPANQAMEIQSVPKFEGLHFLGDVLATTMVT